MINVLFVCLGNVCRSPMAEAIFKQLINELKLEKNFKIESVGTENWNCGKAPHKGTIETLIKNNIPLPNSFARQIKITDIEKYHYILAMETNNINKIHEMFKLKESKIQLITKFSNSIEPKVPDPYITRDFDTTFKLLNESCRNLLSYIIEKEDLE